MSQTRAIVFDLDDTLYPEREYAFSGFNVVARAFADRLGPPADLTTRMCQLFDTQDRRRVFDVLLEERGIANADALVAEMVATFRTHVPNITLHRDAETALSRLGRRYKLGLITDGYAAAQRAKIDALALAGRLDEIIVTDEWGLQFWKPHPRAFQEMSGRLNVDPQTCTYVADNPAKDFIAPNALGWHTVWLKRAGGVHAQNSPPAGGAAHHTITTLDQL